MLATATILTGLFCWIIEKSQTETAYFNDVAPNVALSLDRCYYNNSRCLLNFHNKEKTKIFRN